MKSILEELYMGNIGFDSGQYEPDSHFVQLAKIKLKCMEKLSATLGDQEKEWFDHYCNAREEMEEITRYNLYTKALRFGLLFMAELIMEPSN